MIDIPLALYYGASRIRAKILQFFYKIKFKSIGRNSKLFGASLFKFGENISIGDGCWLHAVEKYKGIQYDPLLAIGHNVSLSDSVHISCAHKIIIGSGTLIGSGVYIGDHSHGTTNLSLEETRIPPALRPLSDMAPILIGKNVWIGDGARILAGSVIPDGSIVGANSVVKATFSEPGIIAGVPASMKRRF